MDAWMRAPKDSSVKQEHKLAILVLASILHYHRNRSILSTKDSAWMLLREYNLQLVDPVTSQLLFDYLQDGPQLTVDYSAYISMPFQWRNIDFVEFLRLIRIPGESPLNASDSSPKGYRSIAHTVHQQRNWTYVQTVAEALNRLVIHYNPAHIQVLSVEIQVMSRYIPYADQMASLHRLELSCTESFGKADLDKTLLFIRTNQITFPKKGSLHIELLGNWMPTALRGEDDSRLAIYEANGCPRVMDAGHSPKFCDLLFRISSASLKVFKDVNGARTWKNGKLAKQQAFLAPGQQLRLLHLRVDEPDALSWAVNNSLGDLGTGRDEKACKLEELTLVSSFSDSLLSAANDAATGLNSTLQKISLETWNDVASNSIPRCAKMGDWVLPKLTDLKIIIKGKAVLLLGALNECCLLQTLFIATNEKRTCGLSQMDEDEAKDRLATLAPIWNLPRLISLVLKGFPALQFNYDSLRTMVDLEQLNLVAEIGAYSWANYPKLNTHVTHDPATASNTNNNSRSEETEGSPMWTDTWILPKLQRLVLYGPPSIVFSFEWLRSCPSLRVVDLVADYFRLQRVPLSWKSPSARFLPRPMESSPCSNKVDKKTHVQMPNNDNNNTKWIHQDTRPPGIQDPGVLWHSKLETLSLKGRFVISEEDLVLALAVYAPNLHRFEFPRLLEGQQKDGYRFVKAVMDAEKMKQAMFIKLRNDAEGSPSRINKLLRVCADYTLTQSDRDRLGLVYAGSEKDREGHWKISHAINVALQEVPMFVLRHQDLIAASDKHVVASVSLDDE
ncbi:hypothetical protein BG006_004798 [Podila minutissima]|uniref:Uncharacterized protein n=1 Tax=Podila minutissima TaxID=64525 RepID=A0A9P5VM53_9FUNG|nr:hypothetical protein BG006_004798 [Podila minutissima]